jgi:hypothetical protein
MVDGTENDKIQMRVLLSPWLIDNANEMCVTKNKDTMKILA